MELTQEYFDERFKTLYTRLDDTATKTDLDKLATKDDLAAMKKELEKFTEDAFEAQQTYIENRFKEVISQIDVRKDVNKLEKEVEQIKKALKDSNLQISWKN